MLRRTNDPAVCSTPLALTRRITIGLFAFCCGIVAPAASVSAQAALLHTPTLRVYLITVGQGKEVWEKFGHNALWFVDGAGVDEAYNWGVFDFRQPRFIQRFLTGDTKYWVESYPGATLIDSYRASDRDIVLQRLNLTPQEASRALSYARWNARGENKFYRYDYFLYNCSTRVRDVIDLALDGALRRAYMNAPTHLTYRSESIRLVDDLTMTQLGIYAALGQRADEQITVWQSMFIPMRMRDDLRGLRRAGRDGSMLPLVADETVVYRSREFRESGNGPRLWIGYLIVGMLLAAVFGVFAHFRLRSSAFGALFRIGVTVWSAIAGLLGLVLLLAWTSTRHVFWFHNENLLLLNPLSLWLALLLGLSSRSSRFVRASQLIGAVIAALALLALLLKTTPWFTQDNIGLIYLVAPTHASIAVALLADRMAGRQTC